MRAAARIARTFRMDPIVVLDSTTKHSLIRLAAHNITIQDERAAQEEAKKGR